MPQLKQEYNVVVGMEVHAQLLTKTKMFCRLQRRLPGRAAQYAHLPGLSGAAGCAAGGQPRRGRSNDPHGAGAQL